MKDYQSAKTGIEYADETIIAFQAAYEAICFKAATSQEVFNAMETLAKHGLHKPIRHASEKAHHYLSNRGVTMRDVQEYLEQYWEDSK